MDPIFLAEIGIVGLIIVIQFGVFFRNLGLIRRLGKLFPEAHQLSLEKNAAPQSSSYASAVIPQLQDNPSFTEAFRDIIQMTNAYLSRNKGSSQGERLQEIAERKSSSIEEAIETNLPLPLYIGLIATFTGVIIGLIKIAFEGVSDSAIQSFIGGVVVGMIGSASGLLLTVRSNGAFKRNKELRDDSIEDYFQFLRTQVFHPESAPVQGSVKDLRESLAAFQDGFAQYQGQMNDSLTETLKLFGELKDVFKQLRSIEQELRGLGGAVQLNDEMIQRQTRYMETYNQKAQEFSRKLAESMGQTDRQIEALVSQNIQSLDKSTKAAYVKMDQYLASLDGGDRQSFVRSLSQDLARIKDDVKTLQEKSVEVNVKLLERLALEENSRMQLSETLKNVNHKLEESQGRNFAGGPAMQAFIYTGIVAFIMGIAGGGYYLFQLFTS
ncbi:MAG: hypothetical protein MRZ79_09900 [Bacteroidia bacterium]|nr:hypothetical protein [Bacteroidia bacterium]